LCQRPFYATEPSQLTVAASTESHLKVFSASFRRAEKTILSIMKRRFDMSTKDILNKIANLPVGPSDIPEVPPPELIGFCVRCARGLRQWKRSTLADFACVSVSTIERVERGEKVSDEALVRIAQGLGYEPGYFTAPRCRLGPEQAAASFVETFGEMEAVAVAPMNKHRQVTRSSKLSGVSHAPAGRAGGV
jgi:hypothetical protein